MKEINDALMDKLLHMARLEFSEKAREEMKKELNKMTEWLQKLREVNIDGVTPLSTMTKEANKLREDLPQPPLAAEEVLSNAPERSSHYFRTPVVTAEKN